MIEISVITEAFNLDEGQSAQALQRTLRYLFETTDPSTTEVLIAVTNPDDPEARAILGMFPRVRFVECAGMQYDQAKMETARVAQGEIIAFLDGDCVPRRKTWLADLVAPIRSGTTSASGGVTRYEGGLFAKICSILDFGFLYLPENDQPLGCYASNNWAITRERLFETPIPPGNLRCNCYLHAQILLAKGTPILVAEAAQVEHEFPNFFKERWRRGSDFVGETEENPNLPAARSSPSIIQSAWRIYQHNLRLDRLRLPRAKTILDLSELQLRITSLAMPILRLVDLAAIVVALRKQSLGARIDAAQSAP